MFLSEKLKYRLTGLVVVVLILMLFLSFFLGKKGQQALLRPTFPPPPALPSQQVLKKEQLFQKIKKTEIELPALPSLSTAINELPQIEKKSSFESRLDEEQKEKVALKVAKNEKPLISSIPSLRLNSVAVLSSKERASAEGSFPKKQLSSHLPALTLSKKKDDLKSLNYIVQVGMFSRQDNAKILVKRLRESGFRANYKTVPNKQQRDGQWYKVVVGQFDQKNKAKHLQVELASRLKLESIITTETI